MPGDDDSPPLQGSGEWGLFIARAVIEVRREFGEVTANRVAALLLAEKARSPEPDPGSGSAGGDALREARAEFATARRERDALEAELRAFESRLDEERARADTAVERAAAVADRSLDDRRADVETRLEAERWHLAEGLAELRAAEADLEGRRKELSELEARIGERMAEAERRLIDANHTLAAAEAERHEAERLAAEAQAVRPAGAWAPGDRPGASEETFIELREWEEELVRRARELDLRAEAQQEQEQSDPPGERSREASRAAGWGRRSRLTRPG